MLRDEVEDFIHEILDREEPGTIEIARSMDFMGKDLEKDNKYTLASLSRCRAGIIFEQEEEPWNAAFSFARAASDVNELNLYELKAVLNERAMENYLEAEDYLNAAYCAFRIAEYYIFQRNPRMKQRYFEKGEGFCQHLGKLPKQLWILRRRVKGEL